MFFVWYARATSIRHLSMQGIAVVSSHSTLAIGLSSVLILIRLAVAVARCYIVLGVQIWQGPFL